MPIFPKTCEGTLTTGQRACVRAQSHRELSAESPARGRPRRQRAWLGRPPWNRKPHDGSPCPCSTVPDHEAGAALTGRGPVTAARGLDPAGRTRDVCLQSCPSMSFCAPTTGSPTSAKRATQRPCNVHEAEVLGVAAPLLSPLR